MNEFLIVGLPEISEAVTDSYPEAVRLAEKHGNAFILDRLRGNICFIVHTIDNIPYTTTINGLTGQVTYRIGK
jgi:hypothetical protein